MAGIDYTSDALLASIKRRITLPDAQNLFDPDDLIAFMGDELSSTIIPLVHSVQQEYWVYRQDVQLVQGQNNYTIPIRGVINGLRLVTILDNNNAEQNEIDFPLLRPENVVSTYNWMSPYSANTLYGFNIEDDHIVCFPSSLIINPTNQIRFRFERAPSQLCATSEAAQITAINGLVLTVNNVPADWTTSTTVDLIHGSPAFQSKGDDLVITAINTNALTITLASVPSTAAVGDWLSVSNTSPIPQIPFQMFPYLCQCVANLCMAGMADTQPYQDGVKRAAQMKEDLLKLLQPRDIGNVQTIINRGGFFDAGQFWGWGAGGTGF